MICLYFFDRARSKIKKWLVILLILSSAGQGLQCMTLASAANFDASASSNVGAWISQLSLLAWNPKSLSIFYGGIAAWEVINFSSNAFTEKTWQTGYSTSGLAWRSDGVYAVAGYSSGSFSALLKLYKPLASTYLTSVTLDSAITAVAWSPDGAKVAVATTTKVYIFSFSTASPYLTQLSSTATISGVKGLSWHQTSSALAINTSASGIYIYSVTSSGMGSSSIRFSGTFTSVAWNPSSSLNSYMGACTSSGGVSIYIIDSSNAYAAFTASFSTATEGVPQSVAWSSDGTSFAVCSKSPGYVKVYSFSSSSGLSLQASLSMGFNGYTVGWSYDNSYLGIVSDTTVNVFRCYNLAQIYNTVINTTKSQMATSGFDITTFLANIAQLKSNSTYSTDSQVSSMESLGNSAQSLQDFSTSLQNVTTISGLNTILTTQKYIDATRTFRAQ